MQNEVKPVTPDQVGVLKARMVPGWVVAEWNMLITRNWDGSRAKFTLGELKDAIVRRWAIEEPVSATDMQQLLAAKGVKEPTLELAQEALEELPWTRRDEGMKLGYYDLEPLFREHGWSVAFDKPGYNENYAAFFVFRRAD